MNYYISDTHFGHEKIISMCERPFENVDEMNEAIITNWNSVVRDDDDIYFLGDFARSNAEKYLKRLNGKKHLIIGNHDGKLLKNPNARAYFESIDPYLKIIDDQYNVVLFHYPICEWDGFFRDTIHLYGHVHNAENERTIFMRNQQNCYNVSADVSGFIPRTLKQIMNSYKM